jgi:hypothetical protein
MRLAQHDASLAASDNARPVAGKGVRLGYTRVSTVAQTLDQQNAALAAAGVTTSRRR